MGEPDVAGVRPHERAVRQSDAPTLDPRFTDPEQLLRCPVLDHMHRGTIGGTVADPTSKGVVRRHDEVGPPVCEALHGLRRAEECSWCELAHVKRRLWPQVPDVEQERGAT